MLLSCEVFDTLEHADCWNGHFCKFVYNKVEIWDKERWDESQNDNDMEDIAEHMGDFGIEI